jgi:hypothetical protein
VSILAEIGFALSVVNSGLGYYAIERTWSYPGQRHRNGTPSQKATATVLFHNDLIPIHDGSISTLII